MPSTEQLTSQVRPISPVAVRHKHGRVHKQPSAVSAVTPVVAVSLSTPDIGTPAPVCFLFFFDC